MDVDVRRSAASAARAGAAGCRRPGRGSPRGRGGRRASGAQRRPDARAATGRRPAPGRCVRPSRRPRSAVASSFQVPFSMVSREIESRIPTAAKLMMSDEPPALRNGSVMPVIGTSVTTTAMLMNAWMHSQPVMPGRQQRAERVRRGERDADPRVGEEQRTGAMTMTAADQPELLADLGEDEVVEGVRDRRPGSGRGRARATPPAPSASSPWTVWKPVPERIGPRVEPGPDAVHLVAAQADHDRRHERRRASSAARWHEVRPGDEEHRERGQGDDRRRAQVGLLEHERDDRGEDDQERHRAAPEAARPSCRAWRTSGRGR